jgi:hypothetical protein
VASGSPLDGTWKLTDITCNGQPGPSTYYSAPDSTTEAFSSDTMVQTIDQGTCSLIYTWDLMTTGTTFTLTYNGASCQPSACNAACGAPIPGDTYTYALSGSTLTVTSTAGGMDDTCLSAGLSNPVVYTLEEQ